MMASCVRSPSLWRVELSLPSGSAGLDGEVMVAIGTLKRTNRIWGVEICFLHSDLDQDAAGHDSVCLV